MESRVVGLEEAKETTTMDIVKNPGDSTEFQKALETGLAGLRAELTTPLSVIFDAVRGEEFIGDDGLLPFTRTNINLGEGLDLETGKFTVKVPGLYLFLLNVYGAPRDGVTLSIK